MKGLRHSRIREIIETQEVETQEELAAELKKRGMDVTQATVSRDIKELMLIKVPTHSGHYRYAFSADQGAGISKAKMVRAFQESVLSIGHSGNLILIKTTVGGASYVAGILDAAKWDGLLGTVAGDDTILIVVDPPEKTEALVEKLRNIKG
jgi:arginine repressor